MTVAGRGVRHGAARRLGCRRCARAAGRRRAALPPRPARRAAGPRAVGRLGDDPRPGRVAEALRLSLVWATVATGVSPGARRAAGLGAGPGATSRGCGCCAPSSRCRWCCRPVVGGVALLLALGRQRAASAGSWTGGSASRCRSRRAAVVVAETFVAMPFLVDRGRGRAPRGRPAVRGGRRDPGRLRLTVFSRVTLPLVAAGAGGRRGAVLGPRAGRVRRDDHLRRQPAGHDADDAARGLPAAPARPVSGGRPVRWCCSSCRWASWRRCASDG